MIHYLTYSSNITSNIDNTLQIDWLTISPQILTVLILLFAAWITYFTWKRSKQIGSTYECDRLFMEIEKTLLNDEKLYDFYAIGPKEEKDSWNNMKPDEKRMWIFCEMNYFHFAFVYAQRKRELVSKEYWSIYDRWLKKLLKYSPIFRDVHKYSSQYFEPEFKKYVDDYLKTVKTIKKIKSSNNARTA